MCMRDKISCAPCKREIDDDDTCVSLRKEEDGTNYVFDSYICAEIFQKLIMKRNVFIREVIP